jgi:hypothetical protein
MMRVFGAYSRRNFEQDALQAADVNDKMLLALLRQHEKTAYGKDHGLAEMQTVSDFKRLHPITTHEHYETYIERTLQGEKDVMFPGHPRMVGETSGTSGTKKLIPVSQQQRKVFFTRGIGTVFDVMVQSGSLPLFPSLQKTCKLFYTPSFTISPGGHRVGPNASAPGDSKHLLHLYTTPAAAFAITQEQPLLYLHTLFALKDERLGQIESNFISNVFQMFVCMEANWEVLLRDIATGQLAQVGR